MTQFDIRFFDIEDPTTPTKLIKEMHKTVADAADKAESFQVTHEPINLKAKLVLKQRAQAAALQAANEENVDSANIH